tara:strand:+ start:741 stop:1049 length:309 start_codon:yes stop_codon:yes gene_type:complete
MAGDCYSANGRWMIGKRHFQLVHGVGILPRDGKPFGHCWIEKGELVLDFSNGNTIKISKKRYYELGEIPVKPYKLYKYTPEQVSINVLKHKHWGPWDLKPPR